MFERCIDECDSFDFLHIDSNSSTDLHNHYCDVAEKISEGLVTLLHTTNHGSIEVYATETYATSEYYGTNTEECVGETANGEAPAITGTDSRFVFLRPRIHFPHRRTKRTCRTIARNCVGTIKANLILLAAVYLI